MEKELLKALKDLVKEVKGCELDNAQRNAVKQAEIVITKTEQNGTSSNLGK